MAVAEIQLPAPGIPTGPLADELLHDSGIEQALAGARAHLGLPVAFVSRYVDGGQRELTHVQSTIRLPLGPGFREPVEDSYCWHVLEGRLPELMCDTAEHPFTRTLAVTAFLPIGCHLCVPIRLSDGSVWGSFGVLGSEADATISHRDLKVVHAFAAMAAQRIEANMAREVEYTAARARVTDMLDGTAITIFQQPIHALDNGEAMGVECLARFPNTRKRGPQEWFEDAEKVGLSVELEMAAVRNAIELLGMVPDGKFATVNVTPATVLCGALRRELEGIDTSKLVIELSEHGKVDDMAALARMLDKLRPSVRIAIDNVGTGYSSLKQLVNLRPDMLKMDMALTRDIHRDPARRALTGALVQLSRDIDCVLVAEGIETIEERDAMQALGVDFGQGYFFARPLPVVAARRHLMGLDGEGAEPDLNAFESRGTPAHGDGPQLLRA